MPRITFDVTGAAVSSRLKHGELAKLVRESITLQKWMLGALIVAAAALAFGQ